MVVHSQDGMDEISTAAPTFAALVEHGTVRCEVLDPGALGVPRGTMADLVVDNLDDAARCITSVLGGETGARRDIVVLNAGAAIYVAGLAGSLKDGVRKADAAIAGGEARNRLDRLVVLTQSFE